MSRGSRLACVAAIGLFTVVGCGGKSSTYTYDAMPDAPREPQIVVNTSVYTFPPTAPNAMSTVLKVVVTNVGDLSTGALLTDLSGPNASEFRVAASSCGLLEAGRNCTYDIDFLPRDAGIKSARLTITASPGGAAQVTLNGTSLTASSTTPLVSISSAAYDFPMTSTGATGTQIPRTSFMLTNVGNVPAGPISAEITGADKDDFAKIEDSCATMVQLQPAATCTLGVRFKPTKAGDKSAQMNVTSPDGVRIGVTLTGKATEKATLNIAAATTMFPTVIVGMESALLFTVTNKGEEKTGTLSYVNTNPNEFKVDSTTCMGPLEPMTSCIFKVTFAPMGPIPTGMTLAKAAALSVTAQPGGVADLNLTGMASSASQIATIMLRLAGDQSFGQVPIGSTSVVTYLVENKGLGAAGKVIDTISGAAATDFLVSRNGCGDRLEANEVCDIQVTFKPTIEGSRGASLQVTASPGGFSSVSLQGTGVMAPAANLSINPDNLRWTQRVNPAPINPTMLVATVRNLGTIATSQISLNLEGQDANQFQIVTSDCPNITLRPGGVESCRVYLRFAPTTIGIKTATLAVTATTGGVARAALFGTGN